MALSMSYLKKGLRRDIPRVPLPPGYAFQKPFLLVHAYPIPSQLAPVQQRQPPALGHTVSIQGEHDNLEIPYADIG